MFNGYREKINKFLFEHRIFSLALIFLSVIVTALLIIDQIIVTSCDVIYISSSFNKFGLLLLFKILNELLFSLMLLLPLILTWAFLFHKKNIGKLYLLILSIILIFYCFLSFSYGRGVIHLMQHGLNMCALLCPVGAMCQNPSF